MKPRTILHTIETGGPGGAETVLLQLATHLDPARFRSVVLISQDGWLNGQLHARGIPTTLVDCKAWYDLRLPRAMIALIRQEKVDLIHSHLPDQNFYSCLVGALTRRRPIVTYHGPIELTRARRRRQALKLQVVRRLAAAVVVVCDYVERLLRGVSFPPEKIVRIYNGIESSRFSALSNGTFRKSLGYGEEIRLVGMVANIRQSKGYEYFVQAARIVADTIPQTRFFAVGDVDEKFGGGLRKLVEQLNLGGRFLFLGFRNDIPEILSDLDVFVLSSTSEGFPLVVLEAMAAGKPVVVTRCGGPEEVVEDGRDGFLVPPTNPEKLAARIIDLLSNPGLAATLGQRARDKVARQFSLERMVRQYEALYERCMNGN